MWKFRHVILRMIYHQGWIRYPSEISIVQQISYLGYGLSWVPATFAKPWPQIWHCVTGCYLPMHQYVMVHRLIFTKSSTYKLCNKSPADRNVLIGGVKTRLTLTDFLLHQGRSDFRSSRVSYRSEFGLDITGGSERRCGFSLCAVPSLTSCHLNLRRVGLKRDEGKSLRGWGDKRLKSIFELANTLSNYRLYTK